LFAAAREQFRRRTEIESAQVRPLPANLLAGLMQVMFAAMPASIPYVTSGALRALAVTTAKRSEALPETPTVGEFHPCVRRSRRGAPSRVLDEPASDFCLANERSQAAIWQRRRGTIERQTCKRRRANSDRIADFKMAPPWFLGHFPAST
jgi:hypothetical protein